MAACLCIFSSASRAFRFALSLSGLQHFYILSLHAGLWCALSSYLESCDGCGSAGAGPGPAYCVSIVAAFALSSNSAGSLAVFFLEYAGGLSQETHWTDKVAPQFPTATWDVYTSPTTDNKSAGPPCLESLTLSNCTPPWSIVLPNFSRRPQAYRAWKTTKAQGRHNPLYVARCYHLFKTAHKAFRRAGKEAKHWFHTRLQDLQAAACSGDSRRLYAGVRTLAPKSSKPKVQLRDSDGHLQDPKTQLQQLETHYRKLYAEDEDSTIQGPPRAPICIDVTEAEMTMALSKLSPHKATPPGLATNSLWRLTSDIVAQLRPFAERFLADQAQFAYLSGRNAAQAIHRVATHCQLVQSRCSFSTPTVVDRHAQQPKPCPHFAGVQLSLDLSSAFDLMDWRLLDKALLASGIYRELLDEGDPLSTAPWLEQNSTIYADDIHLKDTMQSTRELDNMVYRFSKVLDALAAHGMVINSAKSALLLRHRGSFMKGWLRRHLKHTHEGDLLRLRSPSGQVYEIPLRDQHTYLGIRISYHSQAKQAVTYRLQAANQAWQRLRGVLCSTRHLAQKHRISLWSSTVLPTLFYGIAASNPGAKDILRMQHMMTKQVCAITRSFAHLQKESTRDLLHRCSLRTVLEHLQQEAEALHRSLLCLSAQTSFVTVEQAESAREVAATLHLQVQRQWQVPVNANEGATDPAAHQCRECHRVFSSFRLLRSHEAKWHGLKTPAAAPVPFDRYAHGTDGLPTCRHCAHSFRQWDGPIKHIKRNRCQVLRQLEIQPSDAVRPTVPVPLEPRLPDVSSFVAPLPEVLAHDITPAQEASTTTDVVPQCAMTVIPAGDAPAQDDSSASMQVAVPLRQRPIVLETLRLRRWTDLLEMTEIQTYLQHHCPLCYQWLAAPTSIKYHLTMQHPDKLWATQAVSLVTDPGSTVSRRPGDGLDGIPCEPPHSACPAPGADYLGNSPGYGALPLFVRSGADGMVPVLCDAAEKWRKMKEEEPEKISFSLKLAMFKQLLISLHQRLTNMMADEEALARAKALNWIDEHKHWRHLTWNPTQQRLEIDNSLRPLPAEDLLAQLVQMRKAVTEETLMRFKSMKKLSTEVTSDWIQFQMCLSLRPEGGAMWNTLNQWIGQASWHTLGGTVALDSGPTTAPIAIVPTAGPSFDLQAAIEGWSAQVTARYALLSPPFLLCLQIQRFAHVEVRPMVTASDNVRMPIFTGPDTLRIWYASYQVVAVQLHYGDS
ncbi:unnamed protein product [Symbiodinium sp. CCMP2592]|nr:unnamed protein product [Symbiodinium sp. CCMP2592]